MMVAESLSNALTEHAILRCMLAMVSKHYDLMACSVILPSAG